MLKRTLVALTIALMAALVLIAGPAAAASKKKAKKDDAKLTGTVVDMNDQTLGGIRVTVTSKARADFREEAVSDDKGLFTVVVPEAEGEEYDFHLEGEGYTPFDATMALHAGEKAEVTFRILDAETGRRQSAIDAFNAGANAYNAGDTQTAKTKFQEAVALDPDMAEAQFGLADIYFQEKDLDGAAAAIEKFLALREDDENGLGLAYAIFRDRGDSERVEGLMSRLAKTDKAQALATQVYNDGVRAAQAGDNEKAIDLFERAAELHPELAPAYASQATLLYNAARYNEAIAALEKLATVDPENVQGRRITFLVYDALNDTEKRAAALESYIEVDPDGAVQAMYQRADMDFRDGNTAAAEAALLKILELRPDMPRAHYTLGLVFMQKDPAKAKMHLERFLDLAPDDPEAATAQEMLSYL